MEETIYINKQKKKKLFTFLNIFFSVSILIIVSYYLFSAPFNNKDVVIHISSEDNLKIISSELEVKKVIRDKDVFYIIARVFSLSLDIKRGDYKFEKGTNAFSVAFQLYKAKHNIEPIKITLREGLTNEEMANIFADKLPEFRKDLFLQNSNDLEGYLFPDTYFFFPLTTYDEIIKEMNDNFKNKTNKIKGDIENSKRNLEDIIIMASIIELESNGRGDREIISGILWKRFDIGMPLQVDVDRNTYKEKGLPDEPICNPGIDSIIASLNPKDSSYLYYLHDDSGRVYFAKNYDEHKLNINRYLK